MNSGSVFKRCRCGAKVADRVCPECRGRRWSWCYVVDIGTNGKRVQPRGQRLSARKGRSLGHGQAAGRRRAGELRGAQRDHRRALAPEVLDGGAAGIRPGSFASYASISRKHLGSIRLQRLDRARSAAN